MPAHVKDFNITDTKVVLTVTFEDVTKSISYPFANGKDDDKSRAIVYNKIYKDITNNYEIALDINANEYTTALLVSLVDVDVRKFNEDFATVLDKNIASYVKVNESIFDAKFYLMYYADMHTHDDSTRLHVSYITSYIEPMHAVTTLLTDRIANKDIVDEDYINEIEQNIDAFANACNISFEKFNITQKYVISYNTGIKTIILI